MRSETLRYVVLSIRWLQYGHSSYLKALTGLYFVSQFPIWFNRICQILSSDSFHSGSKMEDKLLFCRCIVIMLLFFFNSVAELRNHQLKMRLPADVFASHSPLCWSFWSCCIPSCGIISSSVYILLLLNNAVVAAQHCFSVVVVILFSSTTLFFVVFSIKLFYFFLFL
jgi:hypothetical protein